MTYTTTYYGWLAASHTEVAFPVSGYECAFAASSLYEFTNTTSQFSQALFYDNSLTLNCLTVIISSPYHQPSTHVSYYVALVATSLVNGVIRSYEFDTYLPFLEFTGAKSDDNSVSGDPYAGFIQLGQSNMSMFRIEQNTTTDHKNHVAYVLVSDTTECHAPYNLQLIQAIDSDRLNIAISPFPEFSGYNQACSSLIIFLNDNAAKKTMFTGNINYPHIFLQRLTNMKACHLSNIFLFEQFQANVLNTPQRFSLENNRANFIFTQRP